MKEVKEDFVGTYVSGLPFSKFQVADTKTKKYLKQNK